MDRRRYLVSLALLAACGRAPSTALSKPHVDTLPSGLIEVRNDGPSAWVDTNGWRFVQVGEIRGETGTASELAQVGTVAADRFGHVYVMELGSDHVVEFDSGGKFIRSFGRQGDGPGEFRSGMIAIVRDTIVVQDAQAARMSLFDTGGRFLRSFHSECCFMGQMQTDTAGLIYVHTFPKHRESDDVAFIRFRLDGTTKDTVELHSSRTEQRWVFARGGMRASYNIPYAPSFFGHPDGFGGALSGWTGDFQLAVLPEWKDSSRIFSLRIDPMPLSSGLRDSAVTIYQKNPQLAGIAKVSDIPDHAPAFTWVSRDPAGDFWVQSGLRRSPRLDLFDPSGVYLGRVAPPKGALTTGSWAGDRVYVEGADENDVPVIYVYRLQRRGR
jgi:hypothetical protein